jgi:hypothetical protein
MTAPAASASSPLLILTAENVLRYREDEVAAVIYLEFEKLLRHGMALKRCPLRTILCVLHRPLKLPASVGMRGCCPYPHKEKVSG